MGNLVFVEKVLKMSESTNIPIPCTPNHDFICVKTNWILFIGILANKQNKNRVHSNDSKGFISQSWFQKTVIFWGNLAEYRNLT